MKQSRNTQGRAIVFGFALMVAGLFSANEMVAQSSASASADAEAEIVAGIALEKSEDLIFGSIVRSAEGGSVKVDPNDGDITHRGVTEGQNSKHQPAEFEVSGEAEYLYTISLPKEVKLTRVGGNETMIADEFTHTDGAGTLNGNGLESFDVGATLRVGPNQATGKYRGSFDVSVQYQ